ncbi:proline/serine-rich coiled-coil protein 1 isoform X2 [Myotis myotis]|uniref:proline/serine-rich coiled-coil protein 1 isoform X2 n=1 Tax=Myotis myotis TaxID=51298 RepID=UPI00174B97E5|nr:proline/serine-rich coiled-coil protein 1 isoform X2 [Myotis myotis]
MGDLQEDVKFIVDETLDFGGLSPSDSREEEDIPVLATPEKPLRRGLSHRGDLNAVAPTPQGVRFSLGRLSPAKMEEVLDEANRLAAQLEQCALQERERAGESPGPRRVKPSPRRETFVLKDSPVRDLLPTVSSSARSTPSPSSLTPRLRGSDRKGSARALRAASGKKPSSGKRESPTCNLFPTSKSPASSPLARSTPPTRSTPPARSTPPTRSTPPARSTPPTRGKAGPSGRATASARTQGAKLGPSTSNCQRLSRPQGAAAKPSSRLPVPSAIPKPVSRVPLSSRSVPPSRGALASDSVSTRKGLPRPGAAGHRGKEERTSDRKLGVRIPTLGQLCTLPELVTVTTFSIFVTTLFEDGEFEENVGLDQEFEPLFSNTFQMFLPWVRGKALIQNSPCLHPVLIFVRRSLDLSDNPFLLWAQIKFLFPSDQIFLVPLAAICSHPGRLQPQHLPGKEIRTASKNSVTNHDSPCLDSPPLRPPKPSHWRQFRTPADSGSGARGRDATTAGAQGDGVD